MGRYGRIDYGAGYDREMARRRAGGWGWGRGYDEAFRYARPAPARGYDARMAGWGYDAWRRGPRYDDRFGVREPSPPAEWRGERTPRDRQGDVDRIRAAEIMTPNPEAVLEDTPIAEVARRMRDLDVGVMPVVDDDDAYRLRGLVTDRDIAVRVAAEGKDAKKTTAGEVMSREVQCVGESDHIREVFAVMKRARVRRVPVTGADGRLLGIISQADLAVTYAGLDLQRETEVEEVIERISEPARPRWGREGQGAGRRSPLAGDLPDRVRQGWRTLRREARQMMYDRGFRP